MMNAPLVPVTLAFLTGILVGEYAVPHRPLLAFASFVSAGAAVWGHRRAKTRTLALLLLWGCLGALRLAVWEAHPDTRLKELLSDDPQPVQLHGLVVDDPVEPFEPGEAESDASNQQQATSNKGVRQVCVLALRHLRVDEGWQPLRGRVRTTIDRPRELLR